MRARSSGHDPRPQQVAQVRRERVDGLLVPVETDDVVAAALLRPEVAVEPVEQLLGLALESVGKRGVAHDPLGELGDAQLRVVDVSLDLGRGDRQERDAAVVELDPVPGVLPALVAQALGRARCVLDVPVPVAVAEAVDPFERGQDALPAVANELVVVGEAPVVRQQDEPQRRRVRGSVVRAVRLLAEDGQLALADLVQDPPRLLVAELVDLACPAAPRADGARRARDLGPPRGSAGT